MKSKTLSELANEYGISINTMKKWLKRINIYRSYEIYTIKEVEEIYLKLGNPNLDYNSKNYKT